ncbi:MAG TPA: hypothetical protein VIG47_08050 [Gemmatimonadaceae bacterium]|jgi:hypothetical protein
MEKPKRLTAQQVWNIKDDAIRHSISPGQVALVELCDSHEVYRGFAQRFIDIYSGRVANEQLASAAKKAGGSSTDIQQAELFALFLEIVGSIAPKV